MGKRVNVFGKRLLFTSTVFALFCGNYLVVMQVIQVSTCVLQVAGDKMKKYQKI